MKKMILFLVAVFVAFCDKNMPLTDGVITLVKGVASVEHVDASGSRKNISVKPGDKVYVGDTIVTGEDSAVLFEIKGAQMEIQANSRFQYESMGDEKKVFLQKGNAWTSVSKMPEHGRFTLRTPITVAGVRGTKFLTVTNGETTGTCHCEGKIAFKNNLSGKEEENDRDYLMFYRGKKSVKLLAADFKKMGLSTNHDHSSMEHSSLGKQSKMTPAQSAALQAYVDKKFAEQK